MNRRRNAGRWLVLAVSAAAIAASLYLLDVHVDVEAGHRPDGGLCNLGSRLNCVGAARSSWSKLLGIPIALFGLGFYVGTFAAAATSLRRSASHMGEIGASAHAAVSTLLFLGAVLYSCFLAGVSVFALNSLCPVCVTLYVLNVLGLVGSLLWLRGSPLVALERVAADISDTLIRGPGLIVVASIALTVAAGEAALPRLRVVAESQLPAVEPDGERVDRGRLESQFAAVLGHPDAPVVITEFSDFECPYCSRLAATFQALLSEMPGQVRLEFRQFPLEFHAHARRAALAAVCANRQGRFWELHDAMFANQAELAPDRLPLLAQSAGIDWGALDDCMQSSWANDVVSADQELGRSLGVRGTPAFFVNGLPYSGALPIGQVRQIVRDELDRLSSLTDSVDSGADAGGSGQ